MGGVSTYTIEPGELLVITWQSALGETTLYPQAKIYNSANTLIATINLTHQQNGLYTGSSSALSATGNYYSQIIVYTDSEHTIQSGVDEIITEPIRVAYGFRPSFGGVSVSLTKEDHKQIAEYIKKDLKEIKDLIDKKSEFDPKKDLVKTDIKIPSLNLRTISDKLDAFEKTIKEEIKNKEMIKPKDYSKALERIEKKIKEPKIDFSEILSQIKQIQKDKIQISNQQIPVLIEKLNDDILMLDKMLETLNRVNAKNFEELKEEIAQIKQSIMLFIFKESTKKINV